MEWKDIFKQVFLFTRDQNDIQKDFEIILGVINKYFKKNSIVKIFWHEAFKQLGINSETLQKAIYRLSLLGIASDWTTNFVNHYEVSFNSLTDIDIIESVSEYIAKYEPNTDIQSELLLIEQNTILEKAIWYLLNWTFENIAYNRKQSLKTLSDWCTEFENSESFKKRIDSYFIFTETTFVLQHISENPKEYEKWFEILLTNNQFPNKIEFEKLRDTISRFLESYRNNIGLNFLSGFVRLSLVDYENSDGKERFESALSSIKSNFTTEEQTDFLNRLKVLGKHLAEEQRVELSQSISKYFPELLEELADYYDLAYLLNDIYSQKIQQFKKLNRQLHEQLAKI